MIEIFDVTIDDMVRMNANNRPTMPAWYDGGEVLTWREFDRAVSKAANALLVLGVHSDMPVAVLSGNSTWTWIQTFAILRAGGVLTPLNTLLNPQALAGLIRDSGATFLIVDTPHEQAGIQIRGLAADDGIEVTLLTEDTPTQSGVDLSARALGAPDHRPDVVVHPEDRAKIIYSSGTTGVPKGIVHTHRTRAHSAAVWASMLNASAASRFLVATPPHTNGTWFTVLPALYTGATCVVLRSFSTAGFADVVRRRRPTHMLMVPTMARALATDPETANLDLSCFEFICTGGTPMPADLKRHIRETSGDALGELWGYTEGAASILQPADMAEHLDCIGRAAPETELRVIDENDQEVPSGTPGEMVGRSTWMMREYHNRPDATEEITWRSPEGHIFIRTGDIVAIDEDGWITIRGRKKDMLKSGGLNVFPVDIENVLLTHDSVAECAVVGVPDRRWGEVPVGFVVAADSARADAQHAARLTSWLNERLNKHQRVRELVVVDDLPRNALGKVVKPRLVERYEAGTAERSVARG